MSTKIGKIPTPKLAGDNHDQLAFYTPPGDAIEEGSKLARDMYSQEETTFMGDAAKRSELNNQALNLSDIVDMDGDDGEDGIVVTKVEGYLDPVTSMKVKALQKDNNRRAGHYVKDGELFVFVDCTSPKDAFSSTVKQTAYAERYALNSPQAGIEHYGSPSVLEPKSKPPCLYSDAELDAIGCPNVYRVEFKLTNPI